MDFDSLAAELRKSVDDFALNTTDYASLVPTHPPEVTGTAAVLVVLEKRTDDWYVLLNVRSENLRRHPGEVCFPGGMMEPADGTCIETAIREAEEEIGLPRNNIRIITALKPYITRNLLQLYPVLALQTAPFEPVLNTDEVSEVFVAPLSRFLSAEGHSTWRVFETVEMHSFDLKAPTFGLTAFIAIVLAICVYDRLPEYDMDVITDRSGSAKDASLRAVEASTNFSQMILDAKKRQQEQSRL
uniref:Nudix hydrolase domain-containing protein n=1 Tax=Panagrellus redivivus TaxID=6233 RepID=A0A7E4UUX4_PANRE